jgi:hypothetical protein
MKFKQTLSYSLPILLFFTLSTNAYGQVEVLTDSTTANIAKPEVPAKASDSSLIDAARTSKASSEKLLQSQEQELENATAKLEELRKLVDEGLVARNELLQQEQSLVFLQGTIAGTRQQIAESDRLIAGLLRQEEIKKQAALTSAVAKVRSLTRPTILRYGGATNWSLTKLPEIQAFFSTQFGRVLPTSTIGQSATHNRLGWDHRHAVDVALHPDSTEGQALITYLQSQGIPYLGFRGAVPGVSTGPHIHIGTPSHRLG